MSAADTHFIVRQTHFFRHVPQWPCPVRKRFSNDHRRRGRWKPGGQTVGLSTSEELITVATANLHATDLTLKPSCLLSVSKTNG